MICEEIRNLIGDYIDGELDGDRLREVKEHLGACAACKKFEETLRRAAIAPFKTAERLKAPDEIWFNVRSAIEARQTRRLHPSLLLNKLVAPFLIRRKSALALAAVAVVLLLAVFVLRGPFTTQNIVNSYLEEQAKFLSYLTAEDGSSSYFNDIDLGTTIEKYLL